MNQSDRVVHLRDIDTSFTSFSGLPFGIEDTGNDLISRLYDHITRHHTQATTYQNMLQRLQFHSDQMANIQMSLANMYERSPEDVEVYYYLGIKRQHRSGYSYQCLTTCLSTKLNDTVVRWEQPMLIFIFGEDNKTWNQLVVSDVEPGGAERTAEKPKDESFQEKRSPPKPSDFAVKNLTVVKMKMKENES